MLAQGLHKPVFKNFCAADLTEIGSFSSKNRGAKYLFCFIDVFTKYA